MDPITQAGQRSGAAFRHALGAELDRLEALVRGRPIMASMTPPGEPFGRGRRSGSAGGAGSGGRAGGRAGGDGAGQGATPDPYSFLPGRAPVAGFDGPTARPHPDAAPVEPGPVTQGAGGVQGQVARRLAQHGFSRTQIAGIMGNIEQESNFRTRAHNTRGENSYGLFQWNGPRQSAFRRWAAQQGRNINDPNTQIDYFAHELNTTEGRAGRALRAARTIGEANTAMRMFERYSDAASFPTRHRMAERWHRWMTNNPDVLREGGPPPRRQFFGEGDAVAPDRPAARPAAAAERPAGPTPAQGAPRWPDAPAGPQAPLSYAMGGKRRLALQPELEQRLKQGVAAVYGPGYSASVFSGGQTSNRPGRGTGSTRHNQGFAADIRVIGPDGKVVRGPELARLGQWWAANKHGGVGMEMKGGGIHLDLHKDRAPFWTYGKLDPRSVRAIRDGIAGRMPDGLHRTAKPDDVKIDRSQTIPPGYEAFLGRKRPQAQAQPDPAGAVGRAMYGNGTRSPLGGEGTNAALPATPSTPAAAKPMTSASSAPPTPAPPAEKKKEEPDQ